VDKVEHTNSEIQKINVIQEEVMKGKEIIKIDAIENGRKYLQKEMFDYESRKYDDKRKLLEKDLDFSKDMMSWKNLRRCCT
jgi:hypothetical protein